MELLLWMVMTPWHLNMTSHLFWHTVTYVTPLLSNLHSVALLLWMVMALWHLNIAAHLFWYTVTFLLLICIGVLHSIINKLANTSPACEVAN
jgi:hypothetical protein